MFRVTLIFLASQALSVSASYADDSGVGRLSFNGTAPPVCSFSSAAKLATAQNMALAAGGDGGATVTITDMVDDTSARLNPAAIELIFPAVCNVAHNLTLSSTKGALQAANPAESYQGTFLTEVRYRTTARWGSKSVVLVAGGEGSPPSKVEAIDTAQAGDMTVEIQIDQTDNDTTLPILAGSYEDTLTILIGARF